MSPSIAFLLSKDPQTDHGGDVTLSKLLVRLAREVGPVRVVCLSEHTSAGVDADVLRVRKPPIAPVALIAHSIRSGRSLVHSRFDVPELRAAIEACPADVFVTDHSYMAESYLATNRRHSTSLAVTTGVAESMVWRATRPRLVRTEARRIERDELRVARAADVVGTFDDEEAQRYREAGIADARWLDLTLAPSKQLKVANSGRRLVFIGSRDWRPNVDALKVMLARWPAIARGIAGAELAIIGPGRAPVSRELPDGVVDHGFVPDLRAFLETCRALVAPITTGGGVRVKMLDAASHGLPVVGSSPALGSHGDILGLSPFDDEDLFVDECRQLLLNPRAAAASGERLYEANSARWSRGVPHQTVASLIEAAVARRGNTQ